MTVLKTGRNATHFNIFSFNILDLLTGFFLIFFLILTKIFYFLLKCAFIEKKFLKFCLHASFLRWWVDYFQFKYVMRAIFGCLVEWMNLKIYAGFFFFIIALSLPSKEKSAKKEPLCWIFFAFCNIEQKKFSTISLSLFFLHLGFYFLEFRLNNGCAHRNMTII